MSTRWKSRKFITTLAAQIAAMLVLLMPEHGGEITHAVESVTALAVLLLSALGYITAEASIDRVSADRPLTPPPQASPADST